MSEVDVDAEIREYEPRDRRAVWLVHDRALRAAWDRFDPEFNRYLRHVDRQFHAVGGAFLVGDVGAGSEGTPVADSGVVAIGGFQPLSVRVDPLDVFGISVSSSGVDEVAQVRSVAVDPGWQGRGVGRELMRQLESRASEAEFGRIVLQSPAVLDGTHRFYESLGYSRVERDSQMDERYVWFTRSI